MAWVKEPTMVKPVITKEQLREAGTFAYQYLKPRRFLREIKTDDLYEIRLFDKWELTDPDFFEFTLPNEKVSKLKIEPLSRIVIDKVKKIVYRQDSPTTHSAGKAISSPTPILSRKGWSTFSELKHTVHQLIDVYIKQRFFNGSDIRNGGENTSKIAIETKKVLYSSFRHSVPKMRQIFAGLFWKSLDPETAKLAIQICGHKATTLDYTIIWQNLEEVKDTMNKAPGILPLWINLVKRIRNESLNDNALFCFRDINVLTTISFVEPDIIKKTKLWLECKENWCDKQWKIKSKLNFHNNEFDENEFSTPDDDFLAELSSDFEETSTENEKNPISASGWRYLTKLKPAWTRKITKATRYMNDFNGVVERLARIGMTPRLTITNQLADLLTKESPIVEAVARAAINHTHKLKGIKHFWNAEGSLVKDWVERAAITIDKNQMKAPWSWFMRQQIEWHEMIQRRQRDAVKREKWDSLLETFIFKGYEVVPLVTSLELFDEGKEMHHCVGDYSKQCLLGTSRIFSIRKEGMKVATAEIALDQFDPDFGYNNKIPKNATWSLQQVRGKCNDEVSKDITIVANQIATRYNRLCKGAVNEEEFATV